MKVFYIFGIGHKKRGEKTLFGIVLFNFKHYLRPLRKYLKANLVLVRKILYFLIFEINKIIHYTLLVGILAIVKSLM